MSKRLLHLQMLRGLAAALVVVDHAVGALVRWGPLPKQYTEVSWQLGELGVATFFILSGFIMIHISYDDFGSHKKAFSFALKRLIRIVPLYWLATVITLPVHPVSILETIKSLFFIPYYSSPYPLATVDIKRMTPVLGVGWTLNYEMFFYAMMSVALMFPRRIGLPMLFSAFALLVYIGSAIHPLSQTSAPTTIPTFFSAPIILLFPIGMMLGLIEKRGVTIKLVQKPLLWIGGLFAFAVAVIIEFHVPSAKPFPQIVLFWLPVIIAVAIAIHSTAPTNSGTEKLFVKFGDASYSTYLFHPLSIAVMAKIFAYFALIQISAIAFLVASFIAAHVVGLVVHHLIERRMTAGITKRLSSILEAA